MSFLYIYVQPFYKQNFKLCKSTDTINNYLLEIMYMPLPNLFLSLFFEE